MVGDLTNIVQQRFRGGTLCDPFGGIGTVASTFKSLGFRVWSGDHLLFPHAFQTALLRSRETKAFRGLRVLGLERLEDVERFFESRFPRAGWVTSEYACRRKFFTPENAERIDACRETIAEWNSQGLISPTEHLVLTASLANSADRVANTAGTYYAHLKSFTPRALRPFRLQIIRPVPGPAGRSFLSEAERLVERQAYDVLYLDPPYNERRYGSYYHLPESLCLGDSPRVRGAAGIPERNIPRSAFNSRTAERAFDGLVESARCKMMIVHYTANGLISLDHIHARLAKRGSVERYLLKGLGYTAKSRARHRIDVVLVAHCA
jgi:adenine-specific DNA-methyltransferase